jgi:hypothetical protein
MILGRSPALTLGLIVAGINVAVIVAGVPLTGEQVAVLNAFGAAVVAVVANVGATGSLLGAGPKVGG